MPSLVAPSYNSHFNFYLDTTKSPQPIEIGHLVMAIGQI